MVALLTAVETWKSPYNLYKEQQEYIKKLQETAKSRGIFLVEAGTGFGKTIANLLAILPIAQEQNKLIVYLSKTHQQNRQILIELEQINRANPEHPIRGLQLASRAQLCHIEKVAKASSRVGQALCQEYRKKRKEDKNSEYKDCISPFELEESWFIKNNLPKVAKIEDLREITQKIGGCAYLTARDLIEEYDVVTGHYYYFLSEQIRQIVNIPKDVHLILDEGHNLEDLCCSLVRRQLTTRLMRQAQEEAQLIEDPELEEALYPLVQIFETYIKKLNPKKPPKYIPCEKFLRDLEDLGFSPMLLREIEQAFILFQEDLISAWQQIRGVETTDIQTSIERVLEFFSDLYYSPADFSILVDVEQDTWTFRLECLNPAIVFRPLIRKCASVTICSGTLSPLSLTAEILGIPEAKTAKFGTITAQQNVFVAAVGAGPNKIPLTTKFDQRNDKVFGEYRAALLDLLPRISGGSLIFFPSYDIMAKIDLPNSIGDLKIFFEESNARESRRIFDDYVSEVKAHKKAALVGVFGGKFSEGANFPHELSRAVIICGVPYPPAKDRLVQLRKEYYEKKRPGLGREWYVAQAFRKVSQALGRGWRGRSDYAAGILLDQRYHWRSSINYFPKWMQERWYKIYSWPMLLQRLTKFFSNFEKKEDKSNSV